jgi:urease accessory protein
MKCRIAKVQGVKPILLNGLSVARPRFVNAFGLDKSESDWLLWQIADSAFPTGGFAHSAGLEAAWQHGEIRNRDELFSFVEASLQQLGHAALPFVTAAHVEPERLAEFDQLYDAFTSNHVANRASRGQGQAFRSAMERIFCVKNLPPCSHYAPVFGTCLKQLEVSQKIQHRLALAAEKILDECSSLTLDEIAQVSPLLDVWQGAQDRLYSRLFQS